jgi:hypothetical protein
LLVSPKGVLQILKSHIKFISGVAPPKEKCKEEANTKEGQVVNKAEAKQPNIPNILGIGEVINGKLRGAEVELLSYHGQNVTKTHLNRLRLYYLGGRTHESTGKTISKNQCEIYESTSRIKIWQWRWESVFGLLIRNSHHPAT